MDLELGTDRGVFSAERIDPGTKLLLLEAAGPPAAATTLLDLGCGYGPIALTLARRAPAAHGVGGRRERAGPRPVPRQRRAATASATVRAVTPDEVPDDVRFDGIWSNPPIRIGKAHLHELLERWLARLAPDGEAPPRGAQAPRLRLARPLARRPRAGRPSG